MTDIANTTGTIEQPVGSHTLMGFCSMNSLPGFCLDPPRGKSLRVALALLCRVDEEGAFHIHKLQNIEPEEVPAAIQCMQKLRKLSKQVRGLSGEKRSRNADLESEGRSPQTIKKARTLHSCPTEASLPE